MDDPILQHLVGFTRRWLWLVGLATVLGGGTGAALGLSKPRAYTMRAVVSTATVADDGQIESFDVAADRVSEAVAAAVRAGEIAPGTSVWAHGIMGQPPNLESTHLLEVIATGATREAVTRAIDVGTAALVEAERPAHAEELERIEHHRAAIEDDVLRLESLPVTAERHALYQKAIRELVETTRQASPVRTYAPAVLGRYEPRQAGRFDAVPLPTAIGLSSGLVLGYALAFLGAALASLRRRPAPGGPALGSTSHG